MRTLMILMVVSLATPPLSPGQSVPTAESPAPTRIYHLLREDDDWSFLADPAKRQEFWDPIKYIRLRSDRNDWFLSMGGEAREVWEQIGNDNWGQQPFMNAYLNERYMLYFDVHYGKHVRSFVEFKSGLNSYCIGGPRPIDEKKLDFQAAFLRATMIAHWEELELRAADGIGSQVSFERGSPTGMNMDRVASTMSAIENCVVGRPPIVAALENIKAIAHAPPAPTWLFTLAAAAGAAAMAAIFGVHHLKAVALIMVSAAAGAVLCRTLAQYSANTLVQPLCAALLAGMIGALAVRYNLSSSLRLVAVCPCMILVPGPHVLNGAMDLIAARINLGASRLVHAGLIILAISVGLLLGMGILSVSLPGLAFPFSTRGNPKKKTIPKF
jgi:uncharacterized membrane protein YjjP (DUF1212 family)